MQQNLFGEVKRKKINIFIMKDFVNVNKHFSIIIKNMPQSAHRTLILCQCSRHDIKNYYIIYCTLSRCTEIEIYAVIEA